jgi:ATP-binding cassette subfamily F protein uup
MNLFSISNISKSFEQTLLFEGISFGMEEGDRVGLIGRNGIGKSTLLHIIAGKEEPDTGVVAFNKAIRTEFLNQLPSFDKHMSVLDIVMSGKPEEYRILCRHEELCNAASRSDAEEEELHAVTLQIDEKSAWNLRSTALGFLHSLGVTIMDADVMTLSGGQRKRVALARALLSQPDLLILDEPTNHLDARIVQWLQDELQRSAKGVLLVTHDRYFLDAVSSRIVELDQKRLFSFDGNFEKYLERKEAMIAADDATQAHERNKLRHELAWLQKGAKARRTKQQSRINWIEKMQVEKAEPEQRDIELEVGSVFLGGRIIDAYNISKTMRDKVVFRDFEYSAAPGDKIGFIGPNGAGKSTLLNVLAGFIPPDTGSVRIGDTVTIGYFKQEVPHLPPTQTVIGAVRAVAEYIDGGVGREKYLSARELLERFRFPSHRHGSRVETLSGGERRRLELCRVLMANPNVLLLDEPTNDFDLATLSALEEYLVAFKGVLLVVSHDRAFLDKTVEYIYAFEDDGKLKQYPGNYTAYLHAIEQRTQEQRRATAEAKKDGAAERAATASANPVKPRTAKGLSYKEQKELDEIGVQLEAFAEEQRVLEHELSHSGGADHERLSLISTRLQQIAQQSDQLTERWFELEEKKSAGV